MKGELGCKKLRCAQSRAVYFTNFTSTGEPILISCPVGESFPVSASILNSTTFSLFWLAVISQRPVGAMPRPRGTFPPAETFCRSEEHTSELQSLRHLVCRL